MSDKSFDCVEMKRRGAKQVLERIEGMTIEQELEYWRKGTERLRARQARLQRDQDAPPAAQKHSIAGDR